MAHQSVPTLHRPHACTPAGNAAGPAQVAPIARCTSDYRRAGLALFLAGFASFSLLYCVQPLLPAFAHSFGVTPAQGSLALSLTTGCLAVSIMIAAAFSQSLGRRGLMFVSMALAAICNIVAGTASGWYEFLAARAFEGFLLGGVPAIAMAWLSEEIEPADLGRAMGLYVAGTAFGAMMGRVGMGLATEFASWRVAMVVLGLLCLLASLGFALLLPKSRNFIARPGLALSYHFGAWAAHLRSRALLRLYAAGFLLTGIFVTLFNYVTFRLSGPPHLLGQTQLSLIFLAFAFGIVSSSVAGALSTRFGRQQMLCTGFALMLAGIVATLAGPLVPIIAGMVLVTSGFFVAHAVASSSVGFLAATAKGHAASLYLLFYYLGSSLVGSVGGWFWQNGGWPMVALLTGMLAVAGMLLSLGTQPMKGAGS